MSKSKLRSAFYSINESVKQLKGYSYASRADMRHMLNRCIKDLHELGYKVGHLKGLKPKHVHILVEHWKKQEKSPATIKNYMAKLRKTAVIINNPKLVKPSNGDYDISKRIYAPTHSKAIELINLDQCTDPNIRLSLEAQALFGLRREESMKLVISEAWQGNYLKIKPSWSKGGIGRWIKISNEEQRKWLQKVANQIQPGRSLIPKDKTYKQHLRTYQQQAKFMGIHNLHGLRHAYAQRRYHELSKELDPRGRGLICPLAGGKPRSCLTSRERLLDARVRERVSRALGHSRISITKIYCG